MTIALGPFELTKPIGRGASGQVWQASHKRSGVAVAVKTLRVNAKVSAIDLEQEVRHIAQLTHPAIAAVLDYGRVPDGIPQFPGDTPWFAMELGEGGALHAGLSTLGWNDIDQVVRHALAGLAHAHARGILHLDIKPQNIVLNTQRSPVALVDFGIAQALAGDSGKSDGTPTYMAPERIRGRWHDYGPATDLYSLGCTLWKAITGKPPYVGKAVAVLTGHLHEPLPPFSPRFEVPAGFEGWLRRLLAKQPNDRFLDAPAALRTFEDIAGESRRASKEAPPVLADTGVELMGLRAVPVVGRAELQGRLLGLVGGGSDPGPHCVVLEGTAGMGKSRIGAWLTQEVAERGLGLGVAALHSAVNTPHDGLRGTLEWCLRVGEDDPTECLAPVAEEDRPVVLGMLQGRSTASPRVEARTTRQTLNTLARGRPIVVWIDDAQWADSALALPRLLKRERDASVLCLLTCQTETLDPVKRAELEALSTEWHTLAPLDVEQTGALLDAHLPVAPGLHQRIVTNSQGCPLYAVQLLTELINTGAIEPSGQGYSTADTNIPATLADLWMAILSRVLRSRHDQSALQLAAAWGQTVPKDAWLQTCTREGVHPSWDLMERLTRNRLVVESREAFAFAHGSLRNVVLATAGERRSALHAAWVRYLDGVIHRSTLGVMLAHQALEAGDDERALVVLLDLVAWRTERGEGQHTLQAVDLCTEVMERLGIPSHHQDRGMLHCQHARALFLLGRPEQAEAVLIGARPAQYPAHVAGRMYDNLCLFCRERGDLAGAMRWAQESLKIHEEAGNTRQVVGMKARLGQLLKRKGHIHEALTAIEPAVQYHIEHQHPALSGFLMEKANMLLKLGDVDHAITLLTVCVDAERLNGHPGDLAVAMINLGYAYTLTAGQIERGEESIREGADLAERIDNPRTLAGAYAYLGGAAFRRRDVGVAMDWYQRARALCHEHDLGFLHATTQDVAAMLALDGKLAEALGLVDASEQKATTTGDVCLLIDMLISRGEILLLGSREQKAREVVAEAKALFEGTSYLAVEQRLNELVMMVQ